MDTFSEYSVHASQLFECRRSTIKSSSPASDVVVRVELPEKLQVQLVDYMKRTAAKGRPGVLYRHGRRRVIRRVGHGQDEDVNVILTSYVLHIARPRFNKFKKDGYRAVVKPCKTIYGIQGLGDQQVADKETVMGMVDILWKALEEYRERHEYQWKQSLITTAVENGTEVIMENEVVVESEAQETDVISRGEWLQVYVSIARIRFEQSQRNKESEVTATEALREYPADIEQVEKNAIKALYAGKPDELYRRKNSKRYATYRRMVRLRRLMKREEQKREKEQQEKSAHSRAEEEMVRRREREGDRVRTNTDSLNPFIFCHTKNTFAYSTNLPQIGRYKDQMLKKYSEKEEVVETRSAVEILVSKPSFNSRVMNRFS